MPNKRSPDMKFVGAWCPNELIDAVEVWIDREKTKGRRVNRSDFIVEAATALLKKREIAINPKVAFRTGETRTPAKTTRVEVGSTAQISAALDKAVKLVKDKGNKTCKP